MRLKIYISSIFLVLLSMTACQNFDDLEKDPNRPKAVQPSLVLTGALSELQEGAWNDVMRYNQFYASNYNYYATQEYNWTTSSTVNNKYFTLNNLQKMEQEAIRLGESSTNNPYSAVGKFLRAYYFVYLTQRLGDIPMTDALKGLAETTPAYDTQKDVYKQVLTWLDEANADLNDLNTNGSTPLNGDIYFKGNLGLWQKVVNSFKLRVLISLSKKAEDPDLKVKQRFAEVLTDPTKFPLLESISENLQYVYNTTLNKYPRNPDNFGQNATRENMSSTYLGTLTSLKDPRTFVVAEPSGEKLKQGLQPTDFGAFVGAGSGEDLAVMSSNATTDNGEFVQGKYSFQNRKRFYSTFTAEPTTIIGFTEQCFNIAEAIQLGWANGNAEEYYTKGIKSTFEFYGIKEGANTVYFFKKNGNITNSKDYNAYVVNFDFDDYYNQASVKYSSDETTALNQIALQKYLGFFQNSGWEAFFNQRRTGVPAFHVGPGTANSQRIPKRWQYSANERTRNAENWKAALIRQFGSETDDINNNLWITK